MAKRKTIEAATETKAAVTEKVTTDSTTADAPSAPETTATESVAAPIEAPKVEFIAIDAAKIAAAATQAPKLEAAAAAPKIEIPASDVKPSTTAEPTADEAKRAPERIFPVAGEADAARWRKRRYALLAASIALAAGIGGIVGAAATVGFSRSDESANAATAETRALKQTVAKLGKDLAVLKAGVDAGGRHTTTQFNRIAERLDRAEKAQAEPAAKLARIAETLDRLERRQGPAAPAAPSHAPSQTQAPAADITGSVTALEKSQARPPVIEGWKLYDFYAGRAVLENRINGNLYDVGPGSILPGVGKVEQIKREDNQITVVTPKGIITAALVPPPRRSPYYVPYR